MNIENILQKISKEQELSNAELGFLLLVKTDSLSSELGFHVRRLQEQISSLDCNLNDFAAMTMKEFAKVHRALDGIRVGLRSTTSRVGKVEKEVGKLA